MLEVRNLVTGHGRVRVLKGVSLQVAAGELVTIIGANGAGKSTLLKAIAGLVKPWAGSAVCFDGEDVTGLAPERAVRRGIALVPEGRLLFGPMSVAENLALGAYARPREQRATIPEDLEGVYELFPVLAERTEQSAATLSGGEQQMLAMGRALMSRPRLLLLDEPSLGLAPKVIADIFGTLDELRRRGVTILLVEQDAKISLKHADRGYVLRTGEVALEGSAADLLDNDDVRLIYLGGWHGKE
ncbi:MAG: ABC transporter ATP-binding protein [Actinomycetota bacterium]|nr:ABC transporter ATP-binding protein [Actinomycetota bacterium]